MADMSLDNYIAKAGFNKAHGQKNNKTHGQKRVNMTSNNPRLHVLTSQRRGLMKRSQINRGGATMRRKMSDINKIMAPASASTKSTLTARISGPTLSSIDARQKLVKSTARDAKQNMTVPTDARHKIIGKTKQVDARTKIRSGSQKRVAPGLAPSAVQPVKSILRSATAIVRPLIRPITFTKAPTTKSGLISRATVVPKIPPNAVKPSVKLTRTVNNEAETEITTQGLIQRTLNTKVASDSVVIVESDMDFTITKPSLPKQARFDDNFMITKPNYQAKKITPPESAITMEVMNDMYHVTRKRPMRSSEEDYMTSTQATYQRMRPNVVRLRTAAPPSVHSVTGRELRRQTSGTDQPLLLSDIVNRPLPTTLNQASPEDHEHVDLTAIDTSLRFTVGTNNEAVKPAPPSVNKPSSGPLKLYRPPKDESLPAQIAKYTAGGDTRTKHSSIPSNAPSKLSRPASGAALTTAAARSTHPPGTKLKSHPVLNTETNTTDPDILSPLQGYRIVVTNLHPVVNQDDVIELFGSVGSLKKAQLLKPGHANIVYQDKESAISAVRKFHSRELDGQPMQVKLVTSLTATTSGSKGMSAEVKALIAKSEKNEDSLPTPSVNPALIERALFKTGAAGAHTRPVTFTVKI